PNVPPPLVLEVTLFFVDDRSRAVCVAAAVAGAGQGSFKEALGGNGIDEAGVSRSSRSGNVGAAGCGRGRAAEVLLHGQVGVLELLTTDRGHVGNRVEHDRLIFM